MLAFSVSLWLRGVLLWTLVRIQSLWIGHNSAFCPLWWWWKAFLMTKLNYELMLICIARRLIVLSSMTLLDWICLLTKFPDVAVSLKNTHAQNGLPVVLGIKWVEVSCQGSKSQVRLLGAFSLSFLPAIRAVLSHEAKHEQPNFNDAVERGHLFRIRNLGYSALFILGSCENFVLFWFSYLLCIYICFSSMKEVVTDTILN